MFSTMQLVVLVSETEWHTLQTEVSRLGEALAELLSPTAPPDDVLTTAQAAAYIGLSAEALRRARRLGRIQGVRLNEKDWGFRRSALDAYPRRYSRPSSASSPTSTP
ncbi:Helix-turn-helix domain-containing protein [Hymenobacter psychrotolerans DSM 18569]|uniref:Helix-turn-helix domain-containing protein n=2 Tax=Hymenobacter psychrotolerans TaxID=344998 RepID=A0A1M6UNI4_9BACT|nr:Helix-turn-helix domain-containing protein [Hymenobacter psychrotolerans DSM 18569]